MLKASALLYSVIVSLVISLITGSMIMLSGLSAQLFQHSLSAQELALNADSGLQLLLSGQEFVNAGEEKILDLYADGNDSVFLSRQYWGAFEILISKAMRHGKQEVRIAEAGSVPDPSKAYALYVADLDRPLAVCGNTMIKGTAFLPKAGIKRAYIEGQSYTGTELVYGNTRQSAKELPALNNDMLKQLKDLYQEAEKSQEGSESGNHVSFLQPVVLFASAGKLVLKDSLSGHIAVVSKQMVIIEADAVLKDIIVYAPKILVKKGFRGNLQLFASDSISLEENVSLHYPSVIGILPEAGSKTNAGITLGERDTVSGSVFIAGPNEIMNNRVAGISLSKEAVVYGNVYSADHADIRGKVVGSVMCRKLMLRTSSSVYENHLLNAIIDQTVLSGHFAGMLLPEKENNKKVIKWMY